MTPAALTAWALGVLGAFALGAIPFGLILGKCRGVDLRTVGSRNIGATNVTRVLGRRLGLLCLVLDALKGAVPTLVAGWLLGTLGTFDAPAWAQGAWLGVGFAAVLGHMFSPFLKFRGGKGVATGLGAVLAFFPVLTFPGLAALAAWIAAMATWRYVSLASILAALVLAITTPLVYPVARALRAVAPGGAEGRGVLLVGYPFMIAAVLLAALVIVRHRANIARLRAGTELRVGGAPPPSSRTC